MWRMRELNRFDKEITELRERTANTRYQFVRTELDTCLTALEMARYELSVGNIDLTKKEVNAVEKGIEAIERFMLEVHEEQRAGLEKKLVELKSGLRSMKQELER